MSPAEPLLILTDDDLLAEHWAHEMWETRTSCEISAAIAAEREDF